MKVCLHAQRLQAAPEGNTFYLDCFGVYAELTPGNTWNDYMAVGNVLVGQRVVNPATETITASYYFHTDHLGSISVITDQYGNVVQRLSYDAWGKSRLPNGADGQSAGTPPTTRGFTSQEELSVSGLVHLNGRVYDPMFGRMISADPTVPDPFDPQAWNRYSYVGNDPLTFTDPTGFSWLSNFFNDVAHFFRAVLANPIVRAVAQIAIAAVLTYFGGVNLVLAAAASAGIVTGLSGGKLTDILRASTIAAITAGAFAAAGQLAPVPALAALESNTAAEASQAAENLALNVAAHAAIGCATAAASGGECGPGALSAAAGAGVAPLALQAGLIGGTAISGVVGGLASVAGGGKFEDGAVTGAFGYLFNQFAHSAAAGAAASEGGFLDVLLGRLFGPLSLLLSLSGDTPQEQYLYHYTNGNGYAGILSTGLILPQGGQPYVWLSPTEYSDAQSAQAQLAMSNTPIGYFQIPMANAQPFTGPTVVEGNDYGPGGGLEIITAHPVPITGYKWVPFTP